MFNSHMYSLAPVLGDAALDPGSLCPAAPSLMSAGGSESQDNVYLQLTLSWKNELAVSGESALGLQTNCKPIVGYFLEGKC